LDNFKAVLKIDLVYALMRRIYSAATFPGSPMQDGVAIVAAADQSEKRFTRCKMNLNFSAMTCDDRHLALPVVDDLLASDPCYQYPNLKKPRP